MCTRWEMVCPDNPFDFGPQPLLTQTFSNSNSKNPGLLLLPEAPPPPEGVISMRALLFPRFSRLVSLISNFGGKRSFRSLPLILAVFLNSSSAPPPPLGVDSAWEPTTSFFQPRPILHELTNAREWSNMFATPIAEIKM